LNGKQVGVVQFIKGKWVTGERQFFDRFPDQVHWFTMGDGFTWNTQDLESDTAAAQAAFDKGKAMLASGRHQRYRRPSRAYQRDINRS